VPQRVVILACGLLASLPATAQVSRIPPNAIDRATAVDDARRASVADAAAADRDRAMLDARNSATRIGPVPQSTMTDRVTGANGSVTSAPATVTPPASPN
jgi:hypothetical protein